jgi:hypothetical protein
MVVVVVMLTSTVGNVLVSGFLETSDEAVV